MTAVRETADGGRPLPIPALTGLRMIGAGWVVLFHFQATLYSTFPALQFFAPIIGVGDFGVPLFFILSGYIIWHNYGTSSLLKVRPSAKFLWRRFARLWPVNVASQLLAIPVVWWGMEVMGNWGSPIPAWYGRLGWLQNAFMVQGFVHPEPVFPWNQPSWTLPAEMIAYVLFPGILALILLVGIARRRVVWPWILIALLGVYLVRTDPYAFPYRWMVDLVLFFVAGVLLRIGGLPVPRLRVLSSVVQVAAPVAIVVACYTFRFDLVPSLLAAWVWSLSASDGPVVWLFTRKWAQIAGLSSYSLYMLHWVLFGAGYILLYYVPVIQESFMQLFVPGMLILVTVASWATWRFFETPARRLLNRLFERVWPSPAHNELAAEGADPAILHEEERAEAEEFVGSTEAAHHEADHAEHADEKR